MSDGYEIAALFRAMADRIERNPAAEFAGALLVVPPADSQSGKIEPIEVLVIDPRRDPANFWAVAKGKVEVAAAVFERDAIDRDRQRTGFMR